MIYWGRERGTYDPFFSFSTLAFTIVARLHRKKRKETKKQRKNFKIQTTVKKVNLHLNAQKTSVIVEN